MKLFSKVADILTFSRFVGGFIVVIVFPYAPKVAFWLYVAFALTDWFDGYFARKYGVTFWGKLFDPVADKVLLVPIFMKFEVPWWFVTIWFARELVVMGLRVEMVKRGVDIAAKWLGKWKTVFLSLYAGGVVFLAAKVGNSTFWFYLIKSFFWISLILVVASLVDYVIAYSSVTREEHS